MKKEEFISQEFNCKCGKPGWITENKSIQCPDCGRQYVGKYNKKTLQINANQIFYKTT